MNGRKAWAVFFLLLVSGTYTGPLTAQELSEAGHPPAPCVVVIDPGHGGHDQGAVGPSGLQEKAVTLAVARRLEETLEGLYEVHLTRNGDYWIGLERRTALANHHRADVFVSLHAGGSFGHQARGMAVCFLGPTVDHQFIGRADDNLPGTVRRLKPWDNIQKMHAKESKLLADSMYRRIFSTLNPIDIKVEQAPCLLLRGADMPAVLIEVGYVSHPEEEKNLRDPKTIGALALAIGLGIKDFFSQTIGCTKENGVLERDIGAGRGAAW